MVRHIAIACAVIAACGGPELHVESDTSWSGHIAGDAGTSVDGRGNRVFQLHRGHTCWTFQKNTSGGRLRAYAETPSIFGADRSGDATTVAAFGLVSGCVE